MKYYDSLPAHLREAVDNLFDYRSNPSSVFAHFRAQGIMLDAGPGCEETVDTVSKWLLQSLSNEAKRAGTEVTDEPK